MELFPVRNALGYGELFWSFRQWLTRRRSSHWPHVLGTVEGYELLMARDNGWFVVLYSYEFDGRSFSGEWRKWLLFSFSSVESQTGKVTARLPVGTRLGLRVDPHAPNQSIAEL
jgi:Protein of unknown function (DUF3592)